MIRVGGGDFLLAQSLESWLMISNYPTCPMFGDSCRFASHEHLIIPFAPLLPDPRTGRLVVGSVQHKKEMIGEMCNNIGGWVHDLHYCPARWGLHSVMSTGIRADGCGEYKDDQTLPAEDIFLVVGTGQQVLNI